MGCNILAIRPGVVVMVDGVASVRRALELEGVEGDTVSFPGRADVVEYLGNEELLHVTAAEKDIVAIVRRMIQINNGEGNPDDIDHLGNRRVRSVGELIQNQFRVGMLRQALEGVQDKVTDEAGAIEAMGLKPLLVEAGAQNFKVTYPEDFAMAEAVLRNRR